MIDEIYEREKLDAADAAKKAEQPQPASEPIVGEQGPEDAPRPLQPGESMIHIGEDGMTLTSLVPIQPQLATFRANRDFMRAIVHDWLNNHDEEFWDVLVKARVEALRAKKKHLALVTDPETIASIGKSRSRGK